MKSLYKILFFVLFSLSNFSQAQDWIKDYDGIPIHTWLWWGWTDNSRYPGAIDSMSLIVDIVSTDIGISDGQNLVPSDQINYLKNKGLKLIAVKTRETTNTPVLNWIQHYTDAKYSIWEAEGTPPSVSEAMLEYDDNVMRDTTVNDTTYLILRNEVSGVKDTLIWGPYYDQDVFYYTSQDSITAVNYTVNFKMKIDLNNLYPQQLDNPQDTVCIIQVTYSDHAGLYELGETHIIDADTLQRWEFENYFIDFPIIDYRLNKDFDSNNSDFTLPQFTFSSFLSGDTLNPGPRNAKRYVQFKVIWLGKPQYLLSIDRVNIYDSRGWELFESPLRLTYRQRIIDQANSLDFYNTDSLIVGWLGVDEPVSIDIFKPIKLITEILDDNTIPEKRQSLWLAWMGGWSGTWENPNNKFGTMHLSQWKEFKKRVGRANIWQDFYMYDYPYCDTCSIQPPYGENWRDANIRIVTQLNYKQAYDLDPYFGVSLQCGEVHNTQAEERNITDYELLYNTNIALMCGAKFFSLYTYFAQSSIDSCYSSGLTCHSIVDFDLDGTVIDSLIYTPKYFLLKNKIKPRLDGIMGRTLKKISPVSQVLKTPLNTQFSYSNFINKIIKGDCTTQGSSSGVYDYDLGFFTDSLSRDYFMIISRWYNGGCDPALTIKLKPAYYNNYNIKVVDFINNQTYNTNRFGSISTAPVVGDAGFFGVFPILQYGGSISLNDTTYDGETLLDDLTVENGATLYIVEDYYANANITVKNGGKIIYGDAGKIIFAPGKKLIIQGVAEIKGQSNTNRLALEFLNTEKGIELSPGSSLTLQYCNLSGAYYGISTITSGQYYVNISNSTISSGSVGITLVGNSQESGLSPLPTSIIYMCNFPTTGTAISVSNYNSILIKENTLNGCGISVLNSVSAFLQGNIITGSGSVTTYGIFMSSSTGYVRGNQITNCLNGIHIANSSPDVGGNTLQSNIRHGMYIGSGSIPNLVGYLQINPPLYFPLSGFNKIYSNGSATSTNPADNDGSEIYLANSSILVNNGCNQISDDRLSTPTMSTQYLISGTLPSGGGRSLNAIYNYWGTSPITANRFNSLNVIFSPYYTENCPLPDGGSGGGGSETLVLRTSTGLVVDTIYAAEGVPENFTTLEASYSEADNYFATGNVTQAKPVYEQIVSSNYTTEEKLHAYNKLYTIANLSGADETYFNNLQSTFNNIASSEADSLLKKIYNQNAIKCDVSKEEYLTAISKFDNIIQQNPNSEEAVYAEIDIYYSAIWPLRFF